jgi:hypothetical protein
MPMRCVSTSGHLVQRGPRRRRTEPYCKEYWFDPSLPLAFRIADAFGLSVEEVFDKTDA